MDEGAQIGVRTKIWHFCHIMADAKIGNNCSLGQNVMIASRVVMADNVKIQNNVSVYAGVIIEDDVFLGHPVFLRRLSTRVHRSTEHPSTKGQLSDAEQLLERTQRLYAGR